MIIDAKIGTDRPHEQEMIRRDRIVSDEKGEIESIPIYFSEDSDPGNGLIYFAEETDLIGSELLSLTPERKKRSAQRNSGFKTICV